MSARRLARSRTVADVPPPLQSWVAGADVEPSSSTSLPVDASVGRYVVLCFIHSNAEALLGTDEFPRPERAYSAAQLDVTGTPSYPGVDD